MNITSQRPWISAHWFFLVAPAVIAFDLIAANVVGWSAHRSLEAALLFDFVVQLPLLYVWCYWHMGKQAIVRAVAFSCFSIWLVGYIVPLEQQQILGSVSWLRYVGLVGLVVVEIKAVLFIWRSIFSGSKTVDLAAKELTESGTPLWVSKLLAIEAMFWKYLWQRLQKLFRRN